MNLLHVILALCIPYVRAESPPRYRYEHVVIPTAPNDVAVAARGATARTDGAPGRYHPLPMIDGDTWDVNGHVYTAWNSGGSKTPHWAEITFGRLEKIGSVAIHWPLVNKVYRSSSRYALSAWVDGKWKKLAAHSTTQDVSKTVHRFPALTTQRIRIDQPAGGGHSSSPDVLWISEVEATAVGEIQPPELPPTLLKAPVRFTRNPEKTVGSRYLKTECAGFISGMKAVVLFSSKSGISRKFRIYLTYTGKRDSSVQTNAGPIPPNGRFRSVINLPEFDGRLKEIHAGWMDKSEQSEDITIEEIRIVSEAELPRPWAIRDKTLPWRWPLPNRTGVSVDTSIVVYFSDQIWKDSLTDDHLKLIGPEGGIPCKVRYEPWMRKVVLQPNELLKPNATYFVGMGYGFRDLRGNRIHNRPGEWDGYFFSTGQKVQPSASQIELLGSGGIEVVEWPVDLRVGWPGRVVINVPAGTGKIEVQPSSHLKLVDRTPFDANRTQRKFYFVAKAASADKDSAAVKFQTADGANASIRFPTLSLEDELSTRKVGTLDLPRRWPMTAPVKNYKTRSINYPGKKIEAIRKTWIEAGKPDADQAFPSNEKLYQLVPHTWMQRNTHVNDQLGCPVHGNEVHKFRGQGTWKRDLLNRPFQIQCRIGGEWYPSNRIAENDFTSGDFPDDGFGCWIDGRCYHFIGYYNHWTFSGLTNWYGWTASGANHYKRTGEQIGARKSMILLYRLAEEYAHLAAKPADRMNANRGTVHRHDTPTRRSHLRQVTSVSELRILGMLRDNIWTCSSFQAVCEIYDAIFEGLKDEDRELIEFLRSKNPAIRTMSDIRRFFEDNFIRVGVQMFFDRSVVGNEGAYQEALMKAALLSDIPEADQIVEWVFSGPGHFRYKLANAFFKDGAAFESVSYNSGHVAKLYSVYDTLERMNAGRAEGSDTAAAKRLQQKYAEVFRFPIEMCMLDGAVPPSIGDAGMPQDNEILAPRPGAKMGGRRQLYLGLFRSVRDLLFAQVIFGNGDPKDKDRNRQRLLFEEPELNEAVDTAIAKHGPLPIFTSRLFDGYGLGILRAGEGADKRAIWMSWSTLRGHPHADKLQIGYAGKQRNVMRCQGYPRLMQHFSRGAWVYNPFTHYKAHIWPDRNTGGGPILPRHFIGSGDIQLVEARSEGKNSLNGRTAILINVSAADSYVLDLVRLAGGQRHYLAVPGLSMHQKVTTSGLAFTRQKGGTVAGKDIGHWDVKNARQHFQSDYMQGLTAYYNVAWSPVTQPWWVDWQAQNSDPAAIHLRYHQLPQPRTRVALADGEPFKKKENDVKLRACFTVRQGEDNLVSQFAGLFEYYEGKPFIDSIALLKMGTDQKSVFKPTGVRIKSGDQEDIVLASGLQLPRESSRPEVRRIQNPQGEFKLTGEYGIVSNRGGKLQAALLVNGTELKVGGFSLLQKRAIHAARIVGVDYPSRRVTISPIPAVPKALVGEYIVINSQHRQAMLRVEDVAMDADDKCTLKLDADPLIGEGVAERFDDHQIITPQKFFLAGNRYYKGAVLTNESGRTRLRLSKVTKAGIVFIDPAHGEATSEFLEERFKDGPDKGALRNIYIYDYGIGDTVTIHLPVRIRRTQKDRLTLEAHQSVTISLTSNAERRPRISYRERGENDWSAASFSEADKALMFQIPLDATSSGTKELKISDR